MVGWVIIEIHKLLQFVIPKKKKKERKKERKSMKIKKKNQDIRSYDIFYEITGS